MRFTELRVHGVGGSTPEQVLNSGPARRVAGDDDAGFYVTDGDPDVEAYCWGTLTSGAATRALWLLMLPFTLVNASFWMGPRRRANEALVRLLALSLTATAILTAEGVGTDLLGWQCAARDSCRDRHTWLRWLGHGFMATPARRATAGAVVPLAVLVLLWVLARRTARYERVETHAPGGPAPLQDPTFWYGARQVDRLRQLHVCVGLAVIGLGMTWPLMVLDDTGWLNVADLVLVGVCWTLVVVAGVGVCLPAVVRRDSKEDPGTQWPTHVQNAAVAVLLACILIAVVPARPDALAEKGSALPGYSTAVTTVFLAQLLGVAVLAVVVLLADRDRQASAGGLTQPVFAALGLLFASVFAAGTAFRMADYLDGARSPADGPLHLPDAYGWAALALLVVVVPAAVVVGALVAFRLRAAKQRQRAQVRVDYGQPTDLEDRVELVARTRAFASLPDPAIGWVCWVTTVCLAAAVTAMVLTLTNSGTPVQAVDEGMLQDLLRFGTLGGTWLVSGFAALLVLVGYRSYRRAGLRRHVGILWDLGTFWPRAAHPLAPPCYVERCLPDLTTRVSYLVRRNGGVVVSAHSQGTVIAAALMWQLPSDVLDRVRLITYGSPLARLYGRVYACWFGPVPVTELVSRVGAGRWSNLWRNTDPIGGPVDPVADRQIIRDPPQLDSVDGEPAPDRPHGHFDYELTREYGTVLITMRDSL